MMMGLVQRGSLRSSSTFKARPKPSRDETTRAGTGQSPETMDRHSASQVTMLLDEIERGDSSAPEKLLPLVYEELRRLAQARMSKESPGLTLQPTALVHEAYLRLVGEGPKGWGGRAHFFAAAAEAMRRILIERARRVGRIKHGGGRKRLDLEMTEVGEEESLDVVALEEAMQKLRRIDERLERVVSLRFYAGLTVEQTAELLGTSARTVKRDWEFARAWLYDALAEGEQEQETEQRGKDEPAP